MRLSSRAASARISLVAALLLVCAMPETARAHAVLEATSPDRGAELDRAPERVVFSFDEPVEAAFGSVRVYDERGERVDVGRAAHPQGRADAVEARLASGLGHGTYTATFRVVSADSHPVSGGFVFSVGRPVAPAETLDELIDAAGSGPVTETGFGVIRGLSYLALALATGGLVFVAVVWRPALRACARAGEGWLAASESFAVRARRLVWVAVALGISASALGIVCQGAVASGGSFWSALDPAVIGDVLATRFGTVWALRLLAWVVLAGLLAASFTRLRVPELRPAVVGATGVATASPASAVGSACLAGVLAFLCLTPALAGHASTTDPAWLLVPANFVHVVCMAVWVGGVAMMLLVLPGATGRLSRNERTGLLAASVGRFSNLALAAVIGLVAGGVVQAIADLGALSDLTDTPFGRAILIKIGLLSGLVALGAWSRRRARPRLDALAAAGRAPGPTGVSLRRSLRSELVLMVAVLGVTAVLVSYAPASGATGPFSTHRNLGPARLDLTVDPSRAGQNQVHLYLFDRRTGRQYDRVRELRVDARLPSRAIGPLALRVQKAGPGHYVIRRAVLAPPGEWRLDLSARVSAFDAFNTRIEVPIE